METKKEYSDALYLRAQQIETKFGTMSKLSVGIRVDKFIEEMKKHEVDGFVNIDFFKRKAPSEKGLTHYAVWNDWKKQKQTLPMNDPQPTITQAQDVEMSDIPF